MAFTTAKKLLHLLTGYQRRAIIVLLALLLIGMVLETLGIGLIIPALALMTQSDQIVRYPAILALLKSIGISSHERLVIAGMLALVGVYAIKELFLGFLAWRESRFTFGLQANLSQRLYAGYLRQPYTFHLQHNSAQLIRNTIGQIDEIRGVIQIGLMLIAEVLVLFGILVLLLVVEPIGTLLVVSTLGLSAFGFQRLTRDRLLLWGNARQFHEGLRLQHLQQGLGAVKDVKLLGRESDFLGQYWMHNSGNARVGMRQYTLQLLPKLWIELLAVTGLAVLVIVMIVQGKPIGTLLPTLGLFGAAAFRLMPSVNRVLNAIQSIRFSLPVIDNLYNELCMIEALVEPQKGQSLQFNHTIKLDDVHFCYPLAEASALRGVSLDISHGTSVGFIGTTGAGKSTLVDIILGLLTPDNGTVTVDGIDIQGNLRGWQNKIGYVPQFIYLTDDTLKRNVAFGLPNEQIDESAVLNAIRAAQLEEFVNGLTQGLDTVVGERGIRLSGGQRQRIGIARALYHNPDVLVLDEATSSLDTATEHDVMEAVCALHGDKTILIIAHRLSTVEHCDCLFRLEQGRIVEEGKTSVVLRQAVK